MSSDNAKLNLVTDQDAGEVLREMGYEPEHVEGTKAEQAKALLEEAAKNLDEVYDRTEEGTDRHEAVDDAIWDLDIAIKQMWPTNGSKSIDPMDPMECVTDCFVRCREVAVNGEHGAFSTELMYEATDNVYRAATLLWGSKFTAELESRRELKRKAAAMLEDETDEATEEEIAEAILEVAAKVGMDEAKSRAKADAPTTLEEAMDLLNEAADMANWLRTATEFMADGTEEAREAASIARERAMDVMTNTMAAYYYLNGGTFADRERTDERTRTIIGDLSVILDSYARGDYPCPDRQRDWERIYEGAYALDVDEPTEAADLLFWALIALERHHLETGDNDECSDVNGAKRHIETAIDILWPEKDEQPDRDHGSTATTGNATTDGESMDETPYVEVGYGDGSSVRITGQFGPDTIADVARLATRTTAPTEEEEV